ncbi:trypsin-like peptidase domain-containing protein [Brachybacterium sp. AOP43-C2-M15]|uniref:trypsin-like peptidase domain-containing protein n=1 Tax=Brachybacterium sp. AOP43-C2-M15 TaxID=3457661 RepID=UPI0040336AA1
MDPMKDEHAPDQHPAPWDERTGPEPSAPSAPTPSYDAPWARPATEPGPWAGAPPAPGSEPAPTGTPTTGFEPEPEFVTGSVPPPEPGPGQAADRTTGRRGPGWIGVTGLVALGMLFSSGATLGGVVVYDQFLSPEPAATAQESPATSTEARPAAADSSQGADWAAIAEQVSPSAVAIQVSTSGGTSQGTGVVLDEQGTILTNNHVVDGGQTVQVTTADGLSYAATIVGSDPTSDLAVIRLDSPPEGLQPATFADSSTVEVGQPVMALGTPLGLENTVTTGIVSAVDRPVTASGEEADGSDTTYSSAIQTDAAINPGNSGGPLVDAAGQVIGINTAIAGIPDASGQAGSIGLGFAIPSNTAMMIAEQLEEDGAAQHAFLGVTSQDGSASDGGGTYRGAEVVSIEPGSPAADADLRDGDLVIGVDDAPVGGAAALTGVVRGLEIGSTHQFQVVRDGTVRTVEVTLGVRPS